MSDDHDPIAELERLDRFFDGEEEGERPIDVLYTKGLTIPDGTTLDDESLRASLWEVINGMASIGMYLDSTDHMSDRELYRYLVTDALCEETILPVDGSDGGWHLSPIGGGSEEDNDVYLRYYADDDMRQRLGAQLRRANSTERKASLGSRSIPSATRHAFGRTGSMRSTGKSRGDQLRGARC
jgi:hypothetical protein